MTHALNPLACGCSPASCCFFVQLMTAMHVAAVQVASEGTDEVMEDTTALFDVPDVAYPHMEPKVMVPFATRLGETPRNVHIQR